MFAAGHNNAAAGSSAAADRRDAAAEVSADVSELRQRIWLERVGGGEHPVPAACVPSSSAPPAALSASATAGDDDGANIPSRAAAASQLLLSFSNVCCKVPRVSTGHHGVHPQPLYWQPRYQQQHYSSAIVENGFWNIRADTAWSCQQGEAGPERPGRQRGGIGIAGRVEPGWAGTSASFRSLYHWASSAVPTLLPTGSALPTLLPGLGPPPGQSSLLSSAASADVVGPGVGGMSMLGAAGYCSSKSCCSCSWQRCPDQPCTAAAAPPGFNGPGPAWVVMKELYALLCGTVSQAYCAWGCRRR